MLAEDLNRDHSRKTQPQLQTGPYCLKGGLFNPLNKSLSAGQQSMFY